MNDVFYPEMNQKAANETELVVEMLYNSYKVTCLNGIELKETRSIKFEYENKQGRKVYYASAAGLKRLEKNYKVSHSMLLD